MTSMLVVDRGGRVATADGLLDSAHLTSRLQTLEAP